MPIANLITNRPQGSNLSYKPASPQPNNCEALDIESLKVIGLAWNDAVRHVHNALVVLRLGLRGDGGVQQTAHAHTVREIDTEIVDFSGVVGLTRLESNV